MNKRIKKKKGLSKIRPEECYDLDYTICKFIIPRLYKFKEININSCPADFKTIDEWLKVIDEITFAFEFMKNRKELKYIRMLKQKYNELQKWYEEGMDLFKEYLGDLWD